MNTNINDLFALTDHESDTSIHRNATKLASNEGVSIEMEVDLTDWKNAIR